MAWSLPSLPKLPTKAPGMSLAPVAALNGLSIIAKNLPGLNPPKPIYGAVNTETFIPLSLPDSWGEVIVRFAEYQLTDYPVEDGGFLMANKVRRPSGFDMTWIKTGSDLARTTWLEAIRQQLASDPLARYHILTPNGLFQNMTITFGGFQTRADRGQNMLYLELKCTEVPQIETPSKLGDEAVDPESAPTTELGRVYPSDTPAATEALAGTPQGLPAPIPGT